MFLGRRYPAAESLAMGLVHQVSRRQLENRWANSSNLCENAPLSIANTKTIPRGIVEILRRPDAGRMRAAIERCAKATTTSEGRRASWRAQAAFEGK